MIYDPTIRARVADLVGTGTPPGDAIGQAAAEHHLRNNPPPWLRTMLVEEYDQPEETK